MGLRSPANMPQKPELVAMPNVRYQEVKREEIGNEYLKTMSSGVDALAKAQAAEEARMSKIVVARAKAEANKIRLEQEAKVTATEGWNTLESSAKSSKELKERLTKIPSQYEEKYGPALQTAMMEVENNYTSSVQPYQIGQIKKATKDTFNAVIADEMNDAIISAGDLEQFGHRLYTLHSTVADKARVEHGFDDEMEVMPGMKVGDVIKSEAVAAQSKAIRNGVGILVDGNQIDKAQKLFETYSGGMNAEDYQAAMRDLTRGVEAQDNMIAISSGAEVFEKFGENEKDALVYARGLTSSGKMYGKIVDSYKQTLTANKNQIKAETSAKINEAYALEDEKAPRDKILAKISEIPDPEERAKLIQNFNKNGNSLTPSVTVDTVYSKAVDTILNDYPSIQAQERAGVDYMSTLRGSLNPSDFNTVKSMLNRQKQSDSDSVARMGNHYDKMAMEASVGVNNELGIFAPSAVSKSKRLAVDIASRLYEQNPRMKDSELRTEVKKELYNKLTSPTYTKREGWSRWNNWFKSGFDKDYDTEYSLETSLDNAAGAPSTAASYTSEYISSKRNEIVRELDKAGKTYTDEQVNTLIKKRIDAGKL